MKAGYALTSVVSQYFQKTQQRRGCNNVHTHKSQNFDFGNASCICPQYYYNTKTH